MQLLPILVAFLLGAFALAFVLAPLSRRTLVETWRITRLSTSATAQTDPEQMARAALQEIELDYQLGNLAECSHRPQLMRCPRAVSSALFWMAHKRSCRWRDSV